MVEKCRLIAYKHAKQELTNGASLEEARERALWAAYDVPNKRRVNERDLTPIERRAAISGIYRAINELRNN